MCERPPTVCLDGSPVSSIPESQNHSPNEHERRLMAYTPGPLTSLDTHEITRGFDLATLPSDNTPDGDRLTISFRHSGWMDRRSLALQALKDMNATEARVERFSRCGSAAWILRSASGPVRFRLATNRCRDRFCLPCALEHQRVVVHNVLKACEGKELRFLTLTLKSQAVPLTDQLDRLYKAFATFRRTKAIKQCMTGGVYFTEITLNNATQQWHVHLHCLFEGTFLPHPLIKATWLKVTGDSFIVDVRMIRNAGTAASYISKYASKGIGSNVWHNRDRLAEVFAALAGRRLFSSFGDWKALNLSKHDEDGGEWICIGSLTCVLRDAADRVPEAMAIISYLRRSNVHDPLTLFDKPPP